MSDPREKLKEERKIASESAEHVFYGFILRAPGAPTLEGLVSPIMSVPPSKSSLPRGDQLAIERTLLANERTFLAYFRTSVVFLSSGLAVLSMEIFTEIRHISALLLTLSPLVLGFGLWRLLKVRRQILRHRED